MIKLNNTAKIEKKYLSQNINIKVA